MAHATIPQVIDNYLHLQGEASLETPIPVGSSFWFHWLTDITNRSFSFKSQIGTFTARHERQRNNWYWYAYHKKQGKMRKAYLGKPEELTTARLQAIATTLTKLQTSDKTKETAHTTRIHSIVSEKGIDITHLLEHDPNMQALIARAYMLRALIEQEDVHISEELTQLDSLLALIIAGTEQRTTERETHNRLFTKRENEVIVWLKQGATNHDIAAHLVISEGTVKKHVANICGKLAVKTRAQAISLILTKHL